MNISELRKKSNAFVRDLNLWTSIAIKNSEEVIVKLNRRQMLDSKLSTGAPILPTYSLPYARKKGFTKPNLKVTGDFQKEMFVEANENNGTYFTGSFDEKTPFLTDLYGENLFGLTVDSKRIASPVASKELFKLFNKQVLRGTG